MKSEKLGLLIRLGLSFLAFGLCMIRVYSNDANVIDQIFSTIAFVLILRYSVLLIMHCNENK